MGRTMRDDLRNRLLEAHERGTCLVAQSSSDARRLDYAFTRGEVLRPASHVYALPELWQSLKPYERELYKMRALAQLHPDWVFASYSAAIAHGMSVSYRRLGTVHLACNRTANTRNRSGVVRHVMRDADAITVNGIRVTSVERTAFDCMCASAFPEALAIADSALRVLGKTSQELAESLGTIWSRVSCKTRAIEIAHLADARAQSGGESIARAVMLREGYMPPDLQHPVDDPVNPYQQYFVDFYWELPGWCVAGELDGHDKYLDPSMTNGRDIVEVLLAERLRESRVSGTGPRIMRFSFANILDTEYFRSLLTAFGIPNDYPVPHVALT